MIQCVAEYRKHVVRNRKRDNHSPVEDGTRGGAAAVKGAILHRLPVIDDLEDVLLGEATAEHLKPASLRPFRVRLLTKKV
jgi:hypothetical protein